ncbi:TPA: hypothetical protein N0F65_002893 [Lagenidium giganteum]|uniref:Ribosome-binding factor A n=1 Tax=Lagenidium giganteum TaxID=4803 RepID=A0AAV2ZGI7_9STRA|nr:TPA: hypothetical protein N0F65_002893 [Lagenidium giganteum]
MATYEYDDDEEEDDDSDDDDDDEIERATERIPRRKLLKILEEVDSLKPTGGKNAEKMAIPKTKMAAPLEKKPKMNAEKISHRQEKVGLSLQDFVQHLLLQDADRHEINVFAQVLEVSVSPDLKRAVVFWEPARVQALDTPISKRKVAGVRSRLERMEEWVRAEVARHLNLKYAPIIQFKHKKESKENEARRIFDEEMKWLNRFE